MKFRNWIATVAITALWSGAAPATLTNIENAYETDTANIRLPDNEQGQVSLRECATCKSVVLRVNQDTRYLIGASSPPVSLDQLRKAAERAPGRLVVVFYNLDSKVVTRIVLSAAH